MKLVQYTDDRGYLHQAYIRDEDIDPSIGIPHDPPHLEWLDLDNDVKRELHNALVRMNLITWQDVLNGQNKITGLLKQMKLGHIKKQLITRYRYG